jgi:hypothetical protein
LAAIVEQLLAVELAYRRLRGSRRGHDDIVEANIERVNIVGVPEDSRKAEGLLKVCARPQVDLRK